MPPRPNRQANRQANRPAAAVAVLLLLLQAWLPVQAASAMAAAVSAAAEAASLCLHDEEGRPRPDEPERQRHHTLCPACALCCVTPAALPADPGAFPAPSIHGRLRRVRPTAPPLRAPLRRRPRARGPPLSLDRPHRHPSRDPAGRDAGPRGDHT